MSFDWQTVVVAMVLLWAAVYLARKVWRVWAGGNSNAAGCGSSCGGCSTSGDTNDSTNGALQAKPFVPIESLHRGNGAK